jgi:hypothetical protein
VLRVYRRLVVLHGSWFLIVLTLVAVAERRIATYLQQLEVEMSFGDPGSLLGERVVKALTVVHDARPPEVTPYRLRERSPQEIAASACLVTLRTPSPRAPPVVSASQRIA